MPRLVNLGSLSIDHVYRVPNLAQSGETVASLDHRVFPGGKGLNQSLAAALAGASVLHVGCVGDDGQMLVDVLQQAGVDTSGVRTVTGEASGQAMIQVDGKGANAIVIAGGANRDITADDISRALSQWNPGDWLLLQNEINDIQQVLDRAAALNARVALNVAPVDGRVAGYDLSGVALLIVNEIEAVALLGKGDADSDSRAVVQKLRERWPGIQIVLTMGERGLIYTDSGEIRHMPAFKVEPADETAAGDAFIGYFMAELIAGTDIAQALRYGSAAGALAVTRTGAASSIPAREAVQMLAASGS